MPKYIDLDKVVARREEHYKLLEKTYGAYDMYVRGYGEAINDIENEEPDVNVQEIKHGTWLLKHIGAGHTWECSVCHERPCIYITENTKYCPNCGAKIDMEE